MPIKIVSTLEQKPIDRRRNVKPMVYAMPYKNTTEVVVGATAQGLIGLSRGDRLAIAKCEDGRLALVKSTDGTGSKLSGPKYATTLRARLMYDCDEKVMAEIVDGYAVFPAGSIRERKTT